jgi:hypothetical protein
MGVRGGYAAPHSHFRASFDFRDLLIILMRCKYNQVYDYP